MKGFNRFDSNDYKSDSMTQKTNETNSLRQDKNQLNFVIDSQNFKRKQLNRLETSNIIEVAQIAQNFRVEKPKYNERKIQKM